MSTPNQFMTREISQETEEPCREHVICRSMLYDDLLKGRNLLLNVMFLKENKVVEDTLSFTIASPPARFGDTI